MKERLKQIFGLYPSNAPEWTHPFAPWMRLTLILAAFYNMAWGAFTVFFPLFMFDAFGMQTPFYPELWQCVGMIVGVYGVGYALAAIDPYKHFPIVIVGLLGKILGPIGFLKAVLEQRFPLGFGFNIITNDLIWWIPFAFILKGAYHQWRLQDEANTALFHGQHAITFRHFKSQDDETILQLSQDTPLMLVFLRHIGCTFCRSMLHEIQEQLPLLEKMNVQIAFVHMSEESKDTHAFFEHYGLEDCPRFSDPERTLYKSVGLKRGTLNQLFGWSSFKKGIPALFEGHGVGHLEGDGFQLSGTVLVFKGIILKVHAHTHASDSTPFVEWLHTQRADKSSKEF